MLRKKISEFEESLTSGDNDEIIFVDKTTNPLIPKTKKIKKDNFLSGKVDKVSGKGLSTNDYTDEDKERLAQTSGNNTGDQDLSGKENVGVAQGLIDQHEETYNHELIETALQEETDPIFSASEAAKLELGDKEKLDSALQIENDPVFGASEASLLQEGDKAKIDSALQEEADPIFSASEASLFEPGDKNKIDNIESLAIAYSVAL